jgi:hypothetical protein
MKPISKLAGALAAGGREKLLSNVIANPLIALTGGAPGSCTCALACTTTARTSATRPGGAVGIAGKGAGVAPRDRCPARGASCPVRCRRCR